MNYKHIWIIEVSNNKKYWSATGTRWFITRKSGKEQLRASQWKTMNPKSFYRVSKYMGPIKSGCIKEI